MPFVSPSHLLLICVAAIWGFAFVAQSAGMEYLGPHSFNAARFMLGALSLLPLWFLMTKKRLPQGKTLLFGGLAAGTVMFGGFSFQQIGLQYTTAGNAGFITSMYIVMVPVAGILLGQSTNIQTWSGVILAVLGLYSLSVGPDLTIGYGDLLQLIGALFWTAHVIIIGWLSRKVDAIGLSISQFLVAALWASIAAILYETPVMADFQAAWLPLLYAGVASSGIACTLQIIGQRKIQPSITALILSTEAIFAVLGGWLLLDETFGSKELLGCSLMLAGMLISQWPSRKSRAAMVQS
ncbi:DMT family transporter [Amphritea balenae]|uniref:DMT family transporter n=1 Tax=Amphritea balenae TaxID=452629 RepID=A0A3P1SS13_9GAMM|nr:DMT family transporter [Amphritea balenae]RRC99973.1 DMT family transporter [Amphritea balenae]GGK75475.1 transporter [Amphritea balenae]